MTNHQRRRNVRVLTAFPALAIVLAIASCTHAQSLRPPIGPIDKVQLIAPVLELPKGKEVPYKEPKVRGYRSLAIDYSGLCGAPALLALVDRVEGGKQVCWSLPAGGHFTQEGNRFTMTGEGGAALSGVIIAPTAGVLAQPSGKKKGQPGSALQIESAGSATLFCVMALQHGAGPTIEVQGRGQKARIRIGKRVVSFDGKKTVLGERSFIQSNKRESK
jgi:hypothetical protein